MFYLQAAVCYDDTHHWQPVLDNKSQIVVVNDEVDGNVPHTKPSLNKTSGLTDVIFKGSCV